MLIVLLVLVAGGVIGVRSAVAAVGDQEAPPRTVTGEIDPDAGGPTGPPTEWEMANPTDCRSDAVDVAVEMTRSTVAQGATTKLPVTVTNTGQVPCLLDVGTAQLVVTIYSGDDKIWDSRHCSGDSDRRILLDVGGSDARTVTWHGVRSDTGCPDDPKKAKPGTYRVIATLLDDNGDRLTRSEETFTVK